MPLLKNGALVLDPWIALADEAPIPSDGPVLVSSARWQSESAALAGRPAPIGVRLKNTDAVEGLAPDLGRFELIALEFPKFTDGRAYSQARLLRERLGFAGELRATGQVLADQLLFMRRCGFDAFELSIPDPVAAWRKAAGAFTGFYQPAGDGRATILDLRRRRSGGAA